MLHRFAAIVVAVIPSLSCAGLLANLDQMNAGGTVTPPSIEFQGATLAQTPSQNQLAAFYCPRVVADPFGVPGGAALLCSGFFGPPPPQSDLVVAFDLRFRVKNPNQVPLPLAEILTAITVFPAATSQSLGATCVQLCPAGTAGCTGGPSANGCRASSRDIRSLQDFANAAANLLIASGLTLAAGGTPTFQAPQIAAAADLDVVVRFSFGTSALLPIMHQVAQQSMQQLQSGRPIDFAIPYRIEGTVWVDAGSFGRIAVGYGPLAGTWNLPASGLALGSE